MADMQPTPSDPSKLHPWQAEMEAKAIAEGRSPEDARAWAYAALCSLPDMKPGFLTPPRGK